MRNLSNNALRSINAEATGEIWLALVELNSDSFATPLRFVADSENITHAGNVHTAYAFVIGLPDDEPEAESVVQWQLDNSNRDLMAIFRSLNDTVSAKVWWVLKSAPNVVELGPMELEMRGFEYDDTSISGPLQVEPVFELQFGAMEFTPSNCPALF